MNKEQELRPCMWAEVVADDVTGELLWECREADGRGHVSTEVVVELSAKTFAVGTMLEIREPGFFPEPPSRRSSDEQAEVVESIDYHAYRVAHIDPPGRASPPAVAAGGVTEEMVGEAAFQLWLSTVKGSRLAIRDRWEHVRDDAACTAYFAAARAALTAALAVGDEGIREDDLVTAVWELLRTVHQPTPKAGSDYWHVTAGKHVEFGKLITKLRSLLDFPTPPSRGEGV